MCHYDGDRVASIRKVSWKRIEIFVRGVGAPSTIRIMNSRRAILERRRVSAAAVVAGSENHQLQPLEFDSDISETRLLTIALDLDVMSVMQSQQWIGDIKCLQYCWAVERYLYKRDPTIKPFHFKVEVEEDSSSGKFTFTIKPKRKTPFQHLTAILPSCVGPLLGAAFTFLLRSATT